MTLIIILVVPLVVLGVVAFVLVIAFGHQVSRVTAELEAKKQQRNGAPPPAPEPEHEAPIRPEESPTPAPGRDPGGGIIGAKRERRS